MSKKLFPKLLTNLDPFSRIDSEIEKRKAKKGLFIGGITKKVAVIGRCNRDASRRRRGGVSKIERQPLMARPIIYFSSIKSCLNVMLQFLNSWSRVEMSSPRVSETLSTLGPQDPTDILFCI